MTTKVCALIAGHILKLEVKVGQKVKEGDSLVHFESMKMTIPFESPCDGKVTAIHVKEGDRVSEGDLICTIE